MIDKSKLSKDIEEQIQSLASDVYIQVEEKLTHLITAAVKAEINQNTDQQSKDISAKEQSLQQQFSEKQQLQAEEIAKLKQALAEKQVDEEVTKQNFQVELTQNTINFTETIERIENELSKTKQHSTQQHVEKQSSDYKLEEKLLDIEQNLNDKTQEVDGLNGRIMVLTEQEQSLTKQLTAAKEKIHASEVQQSEAISVIKAQTEASTKQQLDALTEQLQLSGQQQSETVTAIKAQAAASAKQQMDVFSEKLQHAQNEISHAKAEAAASAKQQMDVFSEKLQHTQNEISHAKAEAQQSNEKIAEGLQQKITHLNEQIKQEQNGKAELQQQLSAQQKVIDTEQDKNKQTERKSSDFQAQVVKLAEQAEQKNSDYQAQLAKLKEKTAQQVSDHQIEITKLNGQVAREQQGQLDEIKVMNAATEEAKQLQEMAQQKIIELDKANAQLNQQIATEQNDIKLYQQEVAVLNEQVKVAQEGQENILNRFNSNRDKQELENNKVRETIKFLRDENHELIGANGEQANKFTEEIHELEHKLTEYRLKFEYAQKQLTS